MEIKDFIYGTWSIDLREKIKLWLFYTGIKPNAYLRIKSYHIDPDERYKFDTLLKENDILHKRSKDKSFEEIKEIRRGKVIWDLAGTWNGYDLFKDKKAKESFARYRSLLRKGRRAEAYMIAGRLYGYPSCCIRAYIQEYDPKVIAEKYTYYQYYKKIRDTERKFPFLFHRPCSLSCKKSIKINSRYKNAIKKDLPLIYTEYSRVHEYETPVVIGGYSDIIHNKKSIWPNKRAYEYELITKKKIDGKYMMISYLSREKYEEGRLLDVKLTSKYAHFDVDILRKRIMSSKNGIVHVRKFPEI